MDRTIRDHPHSFAYVAQCCLEDDYDDIDFMGWTDMAEKAQTWGILDGGATGTCGSYEIVQTVSDEWKARGKTTELETSNRQFVFGGGEQTDCKIKTWLPHETFVDGLGINVVPNTSTPVLIGTDMLRYYGLVLDYEHDTPL